MEGIIISQKVEEKIPRMAQARYHIEQQQFPVGIKQRFLIEHQ